MNIEYYALLIPGIIDGFSAIAFELLPILLWIGLPAIIMSMIFGSKDAQRFGALLGLIAYFSIGPNPIINLF